MTGTGGDVDTVCGQVGNHRSRVSEERGAEEADALDVPHEVVADTDMADIYGCNAMIQPSGADVDAPVLKPDEDDGTATMYRTAERFLT